MIGVGTVLKEATAYVPVKQYNGMVPNFGFNLSMLVIWSILLAANIVLLRYKQYWFSSAFICAAIMEVVGYSGRVWSHSDMYSGDAFLMQMASLTIAPVFTMGAIYYQLTKMIEIYGHRFCLLPSPIAYSYIFITFDVISLLVQAAGGYFASSATSDDDGGKLGSNIFIAGLASQVASMTIFMGFMGHLYYRVYIETRIDHSGRSKFSFNLFGIPQFEIDYLYRRKFSDLRIHPRRWVFHYFPYAMIVAVLTVYIRCCYRLAELVDGWSGHLITHEVYFIILDGLMVAIATVTMTVFHPGFAFEGRKYSIPITKGKVDPETLSSEQSGTVMLLTANDQASEKRSLSFKWKSSSNKVAGSSVDRNQEDLA